MKSEVFTTVNLKNVRTKFLDFLGGQNRCNDGARCADCLENEDCSAGEVINLFKMRDDHTFRCFVDHCDRLMGIDVFLDIETMKCDVYHLLFLQQRYLIACLMSLTRVDH